jgi:hypothetical protein
MQAHRDQCQSNDLNLIWFGCIIYPSRWGGEKQFSCSNSEGHFGAKKVLGPSAGRGERPGAVRMLVFLCGVTVWGGLISSQRPFEGLQISNLKQKEKLIFFSTYVLSLNLDENFMGIAVLYFASLCLFFRRFFEVLKINFVTKSVKVQI